MRVEEKDTGFLGPQVVPDSQDVCSSRKMFTSKLQEMESNLTSICFVQMGAWNPKANH